MTRLTKRDVEAMLATYDTDPVGALRTALAKALDRAGAPWAELVAATGLPAAERVALGRAEVAALDRLLQDLNELRSLPGDRGHELTTGGPEMRKVRPDV